VACGESSVHQWAMDYKVKGLEGLRSQWKGGNANRLMVEQGTRLREQPGCALAPLPAGHEVGGLSINGGQLDISEPVEGANLGQQFIEPQPGLSLVQPNQGRPGLAQGIVPVPEPQVFDNLAMPKLQITRTWALYQKWGIIGGKWSISSI